MLGLLYNDVLDRPEEAVAFYHQAAERYQEIEDLANEGRARSNLADTLRRLGRLGEARQKVRRAIDCKAELRHAAELWATWDILAMKQSLHLAGWRRAMTVSDIDTDAGNPDAARAKALAAYLAYRHDGMTAARTTRATAASRWPSASSSATARWNPPRLWCARTPPIRTGQGRPARSLAA